MALGGAHLVGRVDELGVIGAALDALADGRPAVLELVGEPGIGKTRLLAEIARRADERGQLVLSGSASELERDVPFWVFADALDDYVRGLDPARLERLGDDVRGELSVVLPCLAGRSTPHDAVAQHERYRSHRAVRELLALLAGEQPVVLVLDDLHWGDPASVELLGALVHRPPSAPVLLAFAVRPRQLPARLQTALERGHRDGSVTRVELASLTREESDLLLGGDVGQRAAASLYEDSGGNPFYLEQLARMLGRGGSTPAPAPDLSLGGVHVPPIVAAALAEELGLLSDDALLVLEGASVAGDPFDPELAAAAAGTSSAIAMNALDELLALDLVRQTDVPRRFRFRHPLVRRSVYESTRGGWRLGAHERCAEALLERGAGATARAHHVERAARHGDLAAITTLREAGDAAAMLAPASAARWYLAALRLLGPATRAQERPGLLLAYARMLAATGQFELSRDELLECIAIAPADSDALRAQLAAECAAIERLLGRHAEARTRLENALDELHDPGSAEAVALTLELASDRLLRMEYDQIQEWTARALRIARGLDDSALIAAARALQALAAAVGSNPEEARAQCDVTAQRVDGLSDDELAPRLDTLVHLATAEMYIDRFARAGEHAARALQIGRATGQGALFPLIFVMLGTAHWVQGRIAESAAVFDDAIDQARTLENVQGLAWNLFNRSFAATAAGDVEIALAAATESIEVAKRLDDSLIRAHGAWALAFPLLETGKAEEAAELLISSTGGEEMRLIPGGWRTYGLELLTRCLLAAGRPADAERAVAAATACADEYRLPMARGIAARARASLLLDRGDATAAAVEARTSAEALEDVGCVYDAAISRSLAGRALTAAGDREQGADELERAAAAFASYGSKRQLARAEHELRRLGRRFQARSKPGDADAAGISALSERELEVARLIVDRKTNPQIATELFLSAKTVETHIRNMFRKLGVSSRVELARAVEESDRVAGSAL